MAQFSCMPRLSNSCFGGDSGVVMEEGEIIARLADELLKQGNISLDEYSQVVNSDKLYRQEERGHPFLGSRPPPPPRRRKRKKPSRHRSHKPAKQTGSCHRGNQTCHKRKPIVDQSSNARNHTSQDRCEEDPISLEPLTNPCFEFCLGSAEGEHYIKYNVHTLIQYILSSGDFTEPTTRKPFTIKQLRQLDQLASVIGLESRSVVEASQDSEFFAQLKEQRDLVDGIERCLGEVVNEMIQSIDEESISSEEREIEICSKFADFDHYYEQLLQVDRSIALQSTCQYKELVRGPPNKRRLQRNGGVRIVLDFLCDKLQQLEN